MGFEKFNTPLDRDDTLKKAKPKPQHFFSNSPTSSAFRDRGKDMLSPEEEKRLKSIPLAENGQRAPKLINLSDKCTLTEPRMLGGCFGASMSNQMDSLEYCDRGREYLEAEQYDAAWREYNSAHFWDKKNALALLGRGRASREMRRFNDALADFSRALALNPNVGISRILVARGMTYQKMGQHNEAVADFDSVIARRNDRDSVQTAFLYRGMTYMDMGQHNRALADINQVLEWDSSYDAALGVRAILYEKMGQPHKALPDLNRLIEQHDKDEDALWKRGRIYLETGQHGKALADFTKLIRLDRNNAKAFAMRGKTFQAMEKYGEAQEDYKEALTLDRSQDWVQKAHNEVRQRLTEQTQSEASSSRRPEELRSPERNRPTDRHPGPGRPDGEQRVERRLGDYRLKEVLGEGSFAKVYLGEHVDPTKPPAAVKVFKVPLTGPMVNQFFNEVKTLEELNHEHIVRIYDFGAEDSFPYLAMEFARHGTLDDIHPQNTRLSPTRIAEYLDQLAPALDFAHSKKIVHRDLKPANLLLGEKTNGEKKVLIGDFGLAQVFQNTTSRKTQEGWGGTPAYVAPEQLRGKPGPESDQYALGIITYEWLSGHLPFRGNPFEIIGQHLDMEVRPEQIPGIAQEIQNVVFRALEKDSKQRFKSVTAFAQAFKKAVRIILHNSGTQLLRSGRRQEAWEEFNRMLELDENDTFALVSRGVTYRRLGQPEKALKDFTRALELDENDTFALMSRGETYRLIGENNKALPDINRAIQLDPNDATAIGTRGQIYQAMGKPRKAFDDYTKALAFDSSLNWVRQALDEVRPLIDEQQAAGASSSRSEQNLDQGEPELASEKQQLQKGDHEKLIEAHFESGEQHLQAGRNKEALVDFTKTLELDENNVEALAYRGITYLQLGQPEKALPDFTRAIELDETCDVAFAHRGAAYLRLGQPEKALPDVNQAIELDPNDATAIGTRGQIYQAMGKPREALDDYKTSLALDGSPDWVRQALNKVRITLRESGKQHLLSERHQEALEDFNRILGPDENDTSALAHRGITYLAMGQPKKALLDFTRVIQLDPDDAIALAHRGETYRQLGQLDNALLDINRAIKQMPNDAWAIGIRGLIYQAMDGQTQRGV